MSLIEKAFGGWMVDLAGHMAEHALQRVAEAAVLALAASDRSIGEDGDDGERDEEQKCEAHSDLIWRVE